MSALREIFARFGTSFETGPLVAGDNAVNGLIGRLQGLGQVVAGAALVQGIRSFATEFVHVADEIGDTSAMLGLSTTALQEWRHAARLSGVEAGQMDGAFIRLQDQMAAGNPVFRRLGVSVRDASGELRGASDVLMDLADPIAALPSDAARTGALMDLLGRSGARLGPLFSRGSAGIAEVRAELAALGGGVTTEAAEAAGEMDDAMIRLDAASLSLRSRLALFLLPALERLAEAAAAGEAALGRMSDRGRIAEVTLVAIGVAAAIAGARTAMAWVAAAAPFVALAIVVGLALLVFEDLWVGIEGGRSTIADLSLEMEEWGLSWSRDGSIMSGIILAWEYLKGLIASTVNTVSQMAGAVGLGPEAGILGDAGESVTREGAPESRVAGALVAQRRESAGLLGEFLMPDTFERFLAVRDARAMVEGGTVPADLAARAAAPAAVSTVTQTVAVSVDARGMTEAQATRAVESAVTRALATQADDTIDALGQE